MEESDNEGVMPYLFNAKELDEETGLYYYGARYLDPTGTTWLSVDPLFEKYVGMSPYGYCAGNPVKLVDPDGRVIMVGNITYTPGKTAPDKKNMTAFEYNTVVALNYLYNGKSDRVKGVIERLCNTQRYNIRIVQSDISKVPMSYNEKEQILLWDDLAACQTDNGVKLSPANGLFHEMGHIDLHLDLAYAEDSGDEVRFDNAMAREFQKDEPFFPGTEILPTREYETEAAISNGEFTPSEDIKYTRSSYGVQAVKVNSPISNDF